MNFIRPLIPIALSSVLLFAAAIAIIHAQPYDDQIIRTILQPPDCNAPCFIGIQPGITRMHEAADKLEANPWVGSITSYIDSGCCTIAMNWLWNGKQPAYLENGKNTIYFSYNANTGIQTVQNIALHTRFSTGYAILTLGAWPSTDVGALKGGDYALVEAFYPQHAVFVTTTVSCPLSRWHLWQAPMTLSLNTDTWSMSGMKPLAEVC